MVLVLEDEGLHDMSFLWENQSWEPSNSDNSLETKGNANSEEQKNEKDEGVMNKKRKRYLKKVSSAEVEGEKSRESDHEIHIWTERERRKKMKNMFSSLHALLPHLPPKVTIFHQIFHFDS